MKCFVLVVVFMTATVFSAKEDMSEKKKRAVDLNSLTTEITAVMHDLEGGVYSNQLLPRVDAITAQAKAVDCGPNDQLDETEIEDIVNRTTEAIKGQENADKLKADAGQLNRAFYLWAGVTDYLIENDSDASKCEAVVAIWATGQVIHDRLSEMDNTFITFNAADNVGDTDPARKKRRVCLGDEHAPDCYDVSWSE